MLGIALAAALAAAQVPYSGPPPGTPAAEAAIWPYPPPDPKTWWDEAWPKPPEAADPLGGRKPGRGEQSVALDNGVDPSTYRLWGLPPLQWQLVREGELILEVWARPARSVRQSVVRITVRRDGRAFAQARAGYACCEAGIGRRMGFDAELPAGSAERFLGLRTHPMWAAPREVTVDDGGGAADALCVDGISYDLTLLAAGRGRALRRACDPAAVGEAADALEPALAAALGHDARFDVLFPAGADFSAARAAYRQLIAGGGRLKPVSIRPPGPGSGPPPGPGLSSPR